MSACRASLAAIVLAPFGILALSSPLAAQPPRPAVAVRQHPTMLRSVWPADFNRDGHIDFVAGEPRPDPFTPGRVVVRPGNGGGGVGQPIATGVTGQPATIGHFNGDGLIDLVAVDDAGGLWILAGRGNGTFQPPQLLEAFGEFLRFALAADMNGDSRLDLVIGGETVQVRAGRGDLTFDAAVTLPPGSGEAFSKTAGAAADFNRDGRRDLVVAQQQRSIIVYRNTGTLIFVPTEIVIEENEDPDQIYGLTAADLNGDRRVDLVVPHPNGGDFGYGEGGVDVLMGRGDGTFAPGVRYSTGVTGPWTATTGDFNRDGHVDVAVGCNSWTQNDLTDIVSYWDSVAIFPGRGNGLLARPAVFRLDTSVPRSRRFGPWVGAHHALRTADVDEDGHADLVASPLAILLNRPAAPNRPPTADAGPDIVLDRFSESPILAVRMTEPDWDWLRVVWHDQNGRLVNTVPNFEYSTLQDETLTVTVTDDRGATARDTLVIRRDPTLPASVTVQSPAAGQHYPAGTDIRIAWEATGGSVIDHFEIELSDSALGGVIKTWYDIPGTAREFVWLNAGPPGPWWVRVTAYAGGFGGAIAQHTSSAFVIDTASVGPFPWPWKHHGDVGDVGHEGSASFANGVFTVRGAGTGIRGTADEFHYASKGLTISPSLFGESSFSVTARVLSLENVSGLARAGLMIRDGLQAPNRHVSVLLGPTTTAGATFATRAETGGSTFSARRAAITAPAWVKLVRTWDLATGVQSIRAFVRKTRADRWMLIGEQAFPAAADRLQILLVASSGVDGTPAAARFDNVTFDENELMHSTDIGATVEGSTVTDGATTTLEANGANIWGRADAFRYHYAIEDLSRGGSITVGVKSLENTHALAKAGVMIRGELDPGGPHVSLFVTPGGGVRLEYRARLHEEGARFASRSGTAPEWLRLTRNGNVFTAYASADGTTWARVGAITVPLYHLTYVGVAATSHSAGTLATAVFEDLVIRP